MAFADNAGSSGHPSAVGGALVSSIDVRINGNSILSKVWGQVSMLEVEDDLGLPGSFSVEITQSAQTSDPSTWLKDDSQYALGGSLEILLGINKRTAVVMRGEITALEPRFEAGRQPRLVLRGYDKRHRLQRGSRSQTFVDVTDADVVTKIAHAAGVELDPPSSSIRHAYLLQANQTDLDFLNARAQAIGYELLMIGTRLTFRPYAFDAGASAVMSFGVGVQELQFSLSVAAQPTGFSARAWNVTDKEALVGQAGSGDERSRMGASTVAANVAKNAFGAGLTATVSQPAVTAQEVDALVRAEYARASLQLLSVEGLCTGRNDLRAGIVIEIKGVGPRYSGLYYLHSVKHSYSADQGYQTRFEGRRNAL